MAECYCQDNGFVDQQAITHQLLPKKFNGSLRIIELGVILLNVTWFCANRRKITVRVGVNILTYLLITYYLLTYCMERVFENLTGFSASQEIPRTFGTWMVITAVKSARHLSLS